MRYFPIGLFASVMGMAGLSMSFRLIEEIYGLRHIFSVIITILATIIFIINAIFLIYRLIFYLNDIKEDFNNPVKVNFYAAISISLLLLGTLYIDFNETLSFIVWLLGALIQVFLTLLLLTKLIWHSSFEIAQFNPAWFLPIVGNIVAPLGGVLHVDNEINWIFFGIGIVFSIIYMTITFNRLFFHGPLPPPLAPTLFILLAPLGVGVIAYVKLTGEIGTFVYILYGVAFYLGLLFLVQFRKFFNNGFYLTWWAFIFPSAAVTNATIYMYIETSYLPYKILFIIQLCGLILLTVYTFIRTVHLAVTGVIFVKEA